MNRPGRAIVGGVCYVIGGWSRYNVELSEVKIGNGECLKPKYDFSETINALTVIAKNVNIARIVEQLQKLYDIMKKKEKELLNFTNFASVPTFTSYDLNFIIANKMSLVDLYALKSLYNDISKYFAISDIDNIDVVDLYNIELPLNNKNVLELEQKNLAYMEKVEEMHIKIINLINRSA